MPDLRYRQVHLDFHTSELIPNIATRFVKEQFQAALALGHVNSITVFAKCHHSWSYYPTQVGRAHPHLTCDLLGEQIAAGHEKGVRVPIYYTVGWSANDAQEHPEWLRRNHEGKPWNSNYNLNAAPEERIPNFTWLDLCVGTPYRELILAQTEEICRLYPVDGFFYDICGRVPCYCEYCMAGMAKAGLDPDNPDQAIAYGLQVWREFQRRTSQVIHRWWPEATVFYNGTADQHVPSLHEYNTHFELEDLPTTWGGYDKMPARARFFGNTGKQYLGMSGKFHTAWGEFGGFKNADAIRYECALMLAYGARCSMGDQLHPSGAMDIETYRHIGEGFSYVEQLEPYCVGAKPVCDLGIYLSGNAATDEGLARILLEEHLNFDVVVGNVDLMRFKVLILPDSVTLAPDQVTALQDFVARGGSLMLTGQSGLNAERTEFVVPVGARYVGASPWDNDYVQVSPVLDSEMVTSPILMYEGATRIEQTGGEVLAWLREPYFNRRYGHYCSHQNTPYQPEEAVVPAAVKNGQLVYLAHPVCRIYQRHGAYYHRRYFANALQLIYKPQCTAKLPSCGRFTLTCQEIESRYVAHLLYAPPVMRGGVQIIEDTPPLYDVPVTIKAPKTVRRVYLAPQGDDVPFTQENGIVSFTVPRVESHQAVVIDYSVMP